MWVLKENSELAVFRVVSASQPMALKILFSPWTVILAVHPLQELYEAHGACSASI